MSASLVGSEMCIRDRNIQSLPRSRAPDATVPAPRSQTPNTDVPNLCSVSYTHLTLPTICSV
eukprot:1242272-Alexandrium_andersonii.AAC.1